MQVLGRQVALGEDEEAPEDPGAVGESTINHLDENPEKFQILHFLSLIFPSETYDGHPIHASYGLYDIYSMSRKKGSWKFISTTYFYATNLGVVLSNLQMIF